MSERHHDDSVWREQRSERLHRGFSLCRLEMHPHREEHDEVKAFLTSANRLQGRQGVIDPFDPEPLMQLLCSPSQPGRRLDRRDAMPLPCKPRRVTARAGPDIQDLARRASKKMKLGTVPVLECTGLVPLNEWARHLLVAFGAWNQQHLSIVSARSSAERGMYVRLRRILPIGQICDAKDDG